MGSLLSKPKSTTSSQADVEHQKRIEALKQASAKLEAAANQAEHDNKQLLASQFERQRTLAKERIAEIRATIARANELRDARKQLNIKTAVLLCALYYNYPFGKLDPDSLDTPVTDAKVDNSWASNATDIVNIGLTVEVFWVMCKIPQLLPLFWPTGDSEIEERFHNYKFTEASGAPDASRYIMEFKVPLEEYVKGPLKQYLLNVFQSNSSRSSRIDPNYVTAIDNDCTKFLKTVEGIKNDEDLIKRCLAFVQNETHMNWKCFVARAGKGICSKQVKLVPATYPKRCPAYELYECLLILTNVVISRYGQLQSKDGFVRKAGRKSIGMKDVDKAFSACTPEQKASLPAGVTRKDTDIVTVKEEVFVADAKREANDTEGGRCFALNKTWVENCYKQAIKNQVSANVVWDAKTFIPVTDIVLPEKTITGDDKTEVWMKKTAFHEELEVYFLTDADEAAQTNGLVRYVNPTKEFTYEFLNDTDIVPLKFRTPLLNAGISATFSSTFLMNAFNILTTKKENERYDLYRTNNRNLMTSIDYMTICPPALADYRIEDDVNPIPRYMYTLLIEYSCKWDLTFPLNNCMNMGQINAQIMLDENNKDGIKALPIYIWTRTSNIPLTVQPDDARVDGLSKPAQPRTDDIFNLANIKNIVQKA